MGQVLGGKRTLGWAMVAGLLCAPPGAAQEPAPAQVIVRLSWRHGRIDHGKPREIPISPDTPDGVVPPTAATEPLFGRVAEQVWFCVDYEGDPRLWIDGNGDGNLEQEAPVAIGKDRGWAVQRPLRLRLPGDTQPRAVDAQFFRQWSDDRSHIHVAPLVHRRGSAVLAGRARSFVLADGDADLRFVTAGEDRLYLDLDGDGTVDLSPLHPEAVGFGQPFHIGRRRYRAARPADDGGTITFTLVEADAFPPAGAWVPAEHHLGVAGAARTPDEEPLEALIRKFEDGTGNARFDALRSIGTLGTPEAFKYLLRAAKNRKLDENLRGYAIHGMGNPAYQSRSRELRRLADSSDRSRTLDVVRALHAMGAPDRETFYVKLLKTSGDYSTIQVTAPHLALVGTPSSRKSLRKIARTHKDGRTRYQAYLAHRLLADGPPRPLMDAAVKETGNDSLRAAALHDLGLADHEAAIEAARSIADAGALPPRPVQVVILDLLGPNCLGADAERILHFSLYGNDGVASRALAYLAPLRGPAATAALAPSLSHADARVRRRAAELLAPTTDPELAGRLVKQLQRESDNGTREALISALAGHDHPKLTALLMRFATDGAESLRHVALQAIAARGARDADARAFLLDLLGSKDWTARIYALDAAAAESDGRLVRKVCTNLRHGQWQVRAAAADALLRLRDREAVEPLIAQLEKEQRPAVQEAIAAALFATTGQDFGELAHVWRQWWTKHGAEFKVPPDLPARRARPHAGGSRASFYGLTVRSGSVMFVIDQSGSMSARGRRAADNKDAPAPTQLEIAVTQTLAAVSQLRPQAMVGVVVFNDVVRTWTERPMPAGPANRRRLEGFLASCNASGGTNIFDALATALRTPGIDTVFLLSDGAPSDGAFVETDDILREIHRINQTRRIAINCVSIGMDSDLLKQLAARNRGRYVRR